MHAQVRGRSGLFTMCTQLADKFNNGRQNHGQSKHSLDEHTAGQAGVNPKHKSPKNRQNLKINNYTNNWAEHVENNGNTLEYECMQVGPYILYG